MSILLFVISPHAIMQTLDLDKFTWYSSLIVASLFSLAIMVFLILNLVILLMDIKYLSKPKILC